MRPASGRWVGALLIAMLQWTACAAPAPAAPPATQAATAAPAAAAPAASAPTAPSVAATAAPAAAAAPLTLVRMGTQSGVTDISMWLGADRGYFRDEGIDLELVPFSNASEMVPALATGQLEAAGIAPNPAMWNAVARGVDFKVVLDRATFRTGFATQALMVRKELYDAGRAHSLADVRGLSVAITPPGKGTNSACALQAGLVKAGATIDDLNVQNLTFPDMLPALANGSIDSAIMQEPFLTFVLRQGSGVKVMGQDEMFPNFSLGVVAFSAKLQADAAAARGVARAYIRASRAYSDAVTGRTTPADKESIDALIARYTKIDLDTVREMAPTGMSPNGQINPEAVRYCYAFFRDQGLIPTPVTDAQYQALLGGELLDSVLAEIGRLPE